MPMIQESELSLAGVGRREGAAGRGKAVRMIEAGEGTGDGRGVRKQALECGRGLNAGPPSSACCNEREERARGGADEAGGAETGETRARIVRRVNRRGRVTARHL